MNSDGPAFKGASEVGGGLADCAGQVREGMPCAYEYFDAQPGALRVDMAAGGYLLGGAPQSHQSVRRVGADPFGPFGVRAQDPLDGAAGNR